MTVNFNNLRKQSVFSYDRLVRKLNQKIEDGNITIPVEDIQEELDDLRMQLMSISMVYEEDNEDFKDLSDDYQRIFVFLMMRENENGRYKG